MNTEPEVHSTGRPRAEVLTALGKRAATAIRALARSTSAWVSQGAKLARLKRREQALRLKVYGRVQAIGRSVVFLHREGKSSQSLESFPELMRQLESVAAMERELDEVRGQLDRLRPRPLQRSE